ncbi:MAG: PAS domain S-box protein [Planctomycetota bacterium]
MRRQDHIAVWATVTFAAIIVVLSTWVLASELTERTARNTRWQLLRDDIIDLQYAAIDKRFLVELPDDELTAELDRIRDRIDASIDAAHAKLATAPQLQPNIGPPLDRLDQVANDMHDHIATQGRATALLSAEARQEFLRVYELKSESLETESQNVLGQLRHEREMAAASQGRRWLVVYAFVLLSALLSIVLAQMMRYRLRMQRRLGQVEADHEDQQQRFELLAANIDEIFWMTSPDESQMLYVSPSYEKLTGHPNASLLEDPLSWIDIVHPDDRVPILAAHEQRGDTISTDVRSREIRFVRPDGETRWIWMRSQPAYDAHGRLVARTGIAVDITERRAMENALREHEEQLRSVTDHLPGVVYAYDWWPDRPREAHYLGPGLESLVGEDLADTFRNRFDAMFERIDPADRDHVSELGNVAWREWKPAIIDFRFQREGGDVRWFRSSASPTPIPNGGVRWHGVVTDITTVKAAEEDRARTNRKLKVLLGAASAVSDARTPAEVLQIIADTVAATGWNAVTVATFDDDHLDDVAFNGVPDDLRPRLRHTLSTAKALPSTSVNEFRVSRSYFIPADEATRLLDGLRALTQPTHNRATTGWKKNDVAIVPMTDTQGETRGMIWLDAPEDGEMSDAATFEYLEFFADLGSRTLERLELRQIHLDALEALRTSESKFRMLAEHTPGAIYLCRPDEKFTIEYFSPTISDILGYDADAFTRSELDLESITHPDDLVDVMSLIQAAIRNGEPYRAVVRLRHMDGSYRVIEEYGTGVYDEASGELRFVEGFLLDVTARHDAERDRRRLFFAVNNSPDSVITLDHDHVIMDVNDTTCERLGYSRDELVGQSFSRIEHRTETPRTPHVDDSGAARRVEVYESALVTKAGDEIPVEMSSATFVYESLTGTCVFARDITVRKVIEQMLRDRGRRESMLRRELNHRVRNNLSSLMTLVAMTSEKATNTQDFAETIRGRIHAMAVVHTLLDESQWHDAHLTQLVDRLIPEASRHQIRAHGDDVVIPAQQASSFGMVLYEISTNAHKYGALSTEHGRVTLDWTVTPHEDGALEIGMMWREQGGPAIMTPPVAGTGSALIKGLVRQDLNGEVHVRYPRGGAEIDLIVRIPTQPAERRDTSGHARPVRPDAPTVEVLPTPSVPIHPDSN